MRFFFFQYMWQGFIHVVTSRPTEKKSTHVNIFLYLYIFIYKHKCSLYMHDSLPFCVYLNSNFHSNTLFHWQIKLTTLAGLSSTLSRIESSSTWTHYEIKTKKTLTQQSRNKEILNSLWYIEYTWRMPKYVQCLLIYAQKFNWYLHHKE